MKIVMIGYGGHSKVISDLILSDKGNEVIGYFDDKFFETKRIDNKYFGPILSAGNMLNYFNEVKFLIAIGNNSERKQIANRLSFPEDYYATIIHRSAIVSPTAKIGRGTVVLANTVINADTEIGQHAIINTGAVIEHDNKLGNFVHVCPGATLTGVVHIEDGTFIGAGATIIPNVKIGKCSIIGAGATVINDIPSYSTAVGIPARVIKVNEGGEEII
jgi:acetyltransferase EpsM